MANNNGDTVEAATYHKEDDDMMLSISKAYEFDRFRAHENNEKVIFIGKFYQHWGHFVLDMISRCWILTDNAFDNYKIVILCAEGQVLDGNYKRFFELLGIDDERMVKVCVPTRFDEIIVPSVTNDTRSFKYDQKWISIFDTVISNVDLSNSLPKKVYFSRSKFGKPEYGEEFIQRNFEINGYTIMYPEKMSLDDQISILQTAETIACTNSSICLNSVFAKDGLEWIIINKYSARHSALEEASSVRGQRVIFLNGYSRLFNFYGNTIGTRPYLISFKRELRVFFTNNHMPYIKEPLPSRIKNILHYCGVCLLFRFPAVLSFWRLLRPIFKR